jgi:hypothetical protein
MNVNEKSEECVMETEHGQDHAHGCVVAASIRELAAAVRATAPEPPADPDALLTAEEVGELLQLSPRTLKDQAAAGTAKPGLRTSLKSGWRRCLRGWS